MMEHQILHGEICDEYEKKDNRIKVIHKKNGGLSDARNAGIEAAKREIYIFHRCRWLRRGRLYRSII